MDQRKLKKIIIILFLILICLITIITVIIMGKNNNKFDGNKNSSEKENVNNDGNNTPVEIEIADPWEFQEEIDGVKENNKLIEISDDYTYFLLKQCIQYYYNASSIQEALNILDVEAKEKLNITENNVANLYNNFNNPEFIIDKIYKQRIDASKDLYLVHIRIVKNTKDNISITNTQICVKIDEKNVDFSIYPYEYLQRFNSLNLSENDKLDISNINEISQNENNAYKTSLISKENESIIKEFFDIFKFYVKFDNSGLYEKIDNEYKQEKFGNDEERYNNYIKENRNIIINAEINKYLAEKYDNYNYYTIIGKNDEHYIFKAKNFMDFNVFLDQYTVVSDKVKSEYINTLTPVKVRYCINRIIKAINEKDYEFVYSKLNTIQKNNYYRNVTDFKNYITDNFYEKNRVELDDEYLKISEDVYQYNVRIYDEEAGDFSYKTFIMAVTIKDETDFEISITN